MHVRNKLRLPNKNKSGEPELGGLGNSSLLEKHVGWRKHWSIPMLELAVLGMFGMIFRNQNGQTGGKNKLANGNITINSPRGGENWVVGSKQTLMWTSDGVNYDVRIELSRDGGETWTPIVDSRPVSSNLTWSVTGPATTQSRIRVTSICDNKISGTSDANFTISTSQQILTSPFLCKFWKLNFV